MDFIHCGAAPCRRLTGLTIQEFGVELQIDFISQNVANLEMFVEQHVCLKAVTWIYDGYFLFQVLGIRQ